MTIRILVNGAQGCMGQHTVHAIRHDPELELVGTTTRKDNLSTEIQQSQAQVVVDFTTAGAGLHNSLCILEAGAHPVVGTSGFTEAEITQIGDWCRKHQRGALIAPNFSIAATWMIHCAQKLARHFPQVEIIELHHDKKVDSPSGTALYTAEKIDEARSGKTFPPASHSNQPARGLSHHNIPIHAIRLPGLFAHQSIMFGQCGETLTLRHDAIDRQCMMPGVLIGCKKVMDLKGLVYGLEGLLDSEHPS